MIVTDGPIPLTERQRTATVEHLLKNVSGIKHPSAGGGLTDDRDARLEHEENVPGTKWAHNNRDDNALTTVFEKRTGLTVAAAFEMSARDLVTIGGLCDSECR